MNDEHINTPEPMEAVEETKMVWSEHSPSRETAESWSKALLEGDMVDELQSRWNSIQIDFVDTPRTSVEQAEALVAETMEKVTRMLSEKQAALNKLWVDHEDVSTEDLRVALQQYRSFFNRLLIL